MTLHRNLSIPADPHNLSKTEGVVGIGFVYLQRKDRVSVSCIDANDGATFGLETMVEPGRELTRFEADSFGARRMLPQCRGDGFRRRRHTAAPDQVVVLVDHGDRCFLERHVETDILLQFGHETWTSGWRWQGTPTIAALAITPCPDPHRAKAGARRSGQGWPLFSGHRQARPLHDRARWQA